MAREVRGTPRGTTVRPLAAIGTEMAALAALASVAFLIELLVRWTLR